MVSSIWTGVGKRLFVILPMFFDTGALTELRQTLNRYRGGGLSPIDLIDEITSKSLRALGFFICLVMG